MAETAGVFELRDLHATFASLFNAGDVEGLVGLYEADAVLHPSPGETVHGKDAIRASLNGFLSIGGEFSLTTLATFEGPDGVALTHGAWELKGGSADLGGKTAEVLRRQPDGRWLYIIDNPWV
jgi:ketosteroid isomerase-like protein